VPLVLVLAILGDLILQVWMGPRYAEGSILPILAIGSLLMLAQRPLTSILIGLNLHGPIGFATLGMALCGMAIGLMGLALFGWGLTGSALAIGIPLTIGYGFFIPVYACHQVGTPVREYARAFIKPIGCAVPFTFCLFSSRFLLHDHP